MALSAGDRLGPYEILGSLGAGGMGEVWRARHTKLGREVAIKTLPEELAADPDRLARFEREAQTTSNLNHPNILTIFDVGEVDGRPYLAAELVTGATLRARLRQSATGRLAVAEVVDLARQMASGLAAAHDAGIVHRDLLLPGRDWDAVLRQTRATLELAPDYWFALQIAGQAWLASGNFVEAIAAFERAVVASAEVPYTIGLLGNALARAGHRERALEQLSRLQSGAGYVPALAPAFVHAGLGQHDEAFALMERATEDHEAWLSQSLSVNATLDPLRDDPRFQALRRRIGLPDE